MGLPTLTSERFYERGDKEMRGFFWLWVMFLLVCLVADSASYWVVRNRLSEGLDLALDAALVSGVVEDDLIWGRHAAHKNKAMNMAWEILLKNMDGYLSESLSLSFDMFQENNQIWAQGQARVETPFLLGALAGSSRREITINKKINYQGSYR
ncbi:MAG: hypothetical protein FWF83_01995 [Clostridiales bacterium]|nr:hypothetical protein [Clostridiales bacterium]